MNDIIAYNGQPKVGGTRSLLHLSHKNRGTKWKDAKDHVYCFVSSIALHHPTVEIKVASSIQGKVLRDVTQQKMIQLKCKHCLEAGVTLVCQSLKWGLGVWYNPTLTCR
jgi:hypothetical protein